MEISLMESTIKKGQHTVTSYLPNRPSGTSNVT